MTEIVRATTEAPVRVVEAAVVSDPSVDYIAFSSDNRWWPGFYALPQTVDDAEALYGFDLYDRRMIHHPDLATSVRFLKNRVLKGGMTVAPAFDAPDPGDEDSAEKRAAQSDHDEATWGERFVRYSLHRLRGPGVRIMDVLEEMLDCVYVGQRLAEIVTEIAEDGEYVGERVLKAVKPKDRRNYAYVWNTFGGLVGIAANIPGKTPYIYQGLIVDPKTMPNLVSQDKVMVFRFGGKNGSPLGQSAFRDAYDPWLSDQTDRDRADRLSHQFAGGRVYAVIDPTAEGTIDPVLIAQALAKWGTGQSICLPKGVTPMIDYPKVEPSWFQFRERTNRERMIMAVIVNARQILAAEKGSEKDSGVAQDAGDDLIGWLKDLAQSAVESQLFYSLCLWAKGKEWADKYTPKCILGSAVSPDFAANVTALAAADYALDDSQIIATEKAAGIPPRVADWMQKRDAKLQALMEQQAKLNPQPTQPKSFQRKPVVVTK